MGWPKLDMWMFDLIHTYVDFFIYLIEGIRFGTLKDQCLNCTLMSKIYFLLFQQIVQSLVNQLGVDSAHANISTSSSVSVIMGIICLNFSFLADSYMCKFVSEQNTFITLIEWYSTLSLSSAQIIFTHSIEARF